MIVEPLCNGLIMRHHSESRDWVQLGSGRKPLVADAEGIVIKGKRHLWRDVERISVQTVHRDFGQSLFEAAFSLLTKEGVTQSGTFVSVLLRTTAFEKRHRCGPPFEKATQADDAAATELLMRLRNPASRSDFFGLN